MHTLYLQAADSRLASPQELSDAKIEPQQMPPAWKLRAHQAATIRELRFGKASIIINTAITGDGKSLAGQFTLFNDKRRTFTMYPTNELVRDQERSVNALLDSWVLPGWQPYRPVAQPINADELSKIQDDLEAELSRPQALRLLLDSDLVLTNPDIFHLLINFFYKRHGAAPDLLLGTLAHRMRLFVFDEFHLFGVAQVAAVMSAMELLQAVTAKRSDPPRFLFLSATPQDLLTFLASKVDLKVQSIYGEYEHGLPTPSRGYERILQPATLKLYPGRLEDWINEHLEDTVLHFYTQHRPGAKGVIIANSVATAHRLYHLLKRPCDDAGITIGLNTGLTPRAERAKDVDLLVATSTVDVGVDFRINFLIFESRDAASHMQRLGRLGRHLDDGKNPATPFDYFEAHALLPQWVIEAVGRELLDGTLLDRENYGRILREKYPPLQQFEGYLRHWAGVQSEHILRQLRTPEIRTQYTVTYERLKGRYKLLFPGGFARYRQLVEDKRLQILSEILSFRGSSPFMALVQDTTQGSRQIVAYNLVSLLLNAKLEETDLQTLYDIARQERQSIKGLERAEPLGAYYLLDWVPSRRVEIRLDTDLLEEQTGVVIERDGFSFDVLDVPGLSRLNRDLRKRKLVALLLPNYKPETLRTRLRLGLQLELFTFRSADGVEGTAAFARDALLLDSILNRFRQAGSSRALIF